MNFVSVDSIRFLAGGAVLIAGQSITAAKALLSQLVKQAATLVEVHDDCPDSRQTCDKYHYHGIEEPG